MISKTGVLPPHGERKEMFHAPIVMRHVNPKFRANQRISCEFVSAGIIKGLRFEGEPEFTDGGNRCHFMQPEWEYLIYRLQNGLPCQTPWGWVKESQICGGTADANTH